MQIILKVPRPGTYTLGFKFRFKPNSLGELFDVTSPIHKLMPVEIRKLAEEPTFNQILAYIAKGIDSDDLTFGHAELTIDSSNRRQWKITHVYFDSRDKTKYTFHRVD